MSTTARCRNSVAAQPEQSWHTGQPQPVTNARVIQRLDGVFWPKLGPDCSLETPREAAAVIAAHESWSDTGDTE